MKKDNIDSPLLQEIKDDIRKHPVAGRILIRDSEGWDISGGEEQIQRFRNYGFRVIFVEDVGTISTLTSEEDGSGEAFDALLMIIAQEIEDRRVSTAVAVRAELNGCRPTFLFDGNKNELSEWSAWSAVRTPELTIDAIRDCIDQVLQDKAVVHFTSPLPASVFGQKATILDVKVIRIHDGVCPDVFCEVQDSELTKLFPFRTHVEGGRLVVVDHGQFGHGSGCILRGFDDLSSAEVLALAQQIVEELNKNTRIQEAVSKCER